jgi:hypothetical protein
VSATSSDGEQINTEEPGAGRARRKERMLDFVSDEILKRRDSVDFVSVPKAGEIPFCRESICGSLIDQSIARAAIPHFERNATALIRNSPMPETKRSDMLQHQAPPISVRTTTYEYIMFRYSICSKLWLKRQYCQTCTRP